MDKKIVSMLIFSLVAFLLSSCGQSITEQNNTANDASIDTLNYDIYTEKVIENNPALDFARMVIEKYYRNKDLAEQNDLSKYVSPTVLKLMNTKIELWQFHIKNFNYAYDDYKITINPAQSDKWQESATTVYLILGVKRLYVYNFLSIPKKNDEATTMGEALELKMIKKPDGGYEIIDCYNGFDILDDLYREALNDKTDADDFLKNYVDKFKVNDIRRKKEDDEYKKKHKERMLIQKKNDKGFTNLSREAIQTWVRDNFNKSKPISSISTVPYFDFSTISGNYA